MNQKIVDLQDANSHKLGEKHICKVSAVNMTKKVVHISTPAGIRYPGEHPSRPTCHEVRSSRHTHPQSLCQEVGHIQSCIGADGILCEIQECQQVIAKDLGESNSACLMVAMTQKDLNV